MASKTLFKSVVGKLLPKSDAINHEFAPAYAFTPRQALAQYVVTGCLNATFYASAEEQLETVLTLCQKVDAEFVAKTAVFASEKGFMKDSPALLCSALSVHRPDLLSKVFDRVIDNGKMLRNFVQIMRSGVVGRKSLGSLPKRLVRQWLESRNDEQVFHASVGQSPSLGDILRMVHPKPQTKSREALYGYLLGREVAQDTLPEFVQKYEAFKAGDSLEVPNVPFQMLTSLEISQKEWLVIARNASWQMTRMNLNTFARHGVFNEPAMTELIAERLLNPDAIAKGRAFPYQLMVAFKSTDETIPNQVREALQDAMEIAITNVPGLEGKAYVCPDVSGSMKGAAVTGHRQGATSTVRCIDVAALVAAAMLRKNPDAGVIPFEAKVVEIRLNPRDSVMTNAEKLAAIGGGGTNCSAPLALLNQQKARGDLVVFVSDNQSWVDARKGQTEMIRQWSIFKQRNPCAKLVCIDIQPYGTTQAAELRDILNVGGFSDQVFDLVADFAAGHLNDDHWVGRIQSVEL